VTAGLCGGGVVVVVGEQRQQQQSDGERLGGENFNPHPPDHPVEHLRRYDGLV
jgi:hypothetical protein